MVRILVSAKIMWIFLVVGLASGLKFLPEPDFNLARTHPMHFLGRFGSGFFLGESVRICQVGRPRSAMD